MLLIALLALGCVLAIASSQALALKQRGYAFGKSFGSEGSGSGQLKSPQGVAVNEHTGDVYVVDAGNNRVDRFSKNGEFIEAWGVGVKTGAKEYQTCTTTTTCKAGIASKGKGGLHNAKGIAIDNDPSSPSFGDVYVEAVTSYEEGEKEFEGGIYDKFTAGGGLIALFKGWKEKESASAELFEAPHGLTVNALGQFIVYNEEAAVYFSNDEKNKFMKLVESEVFGEAEARNGIAEDAAGDIYFGVSELENEPASATVVAKTAFLEGSTTETSTLIGALDAHNTTGFALDPKTQNLFLDEGENVAFVTPEGEVLDRFGSEGGETVLKGGTGVATTPDASTTNMSDVVVAEAGKGRIDIFVPEPAGAPRIDELGAVNTAASSTELSGAIDPHGEASEYFFRFSPGAVPAAGSPCTSPCVQVPAPSGKVGAEGTFGDVTLPNQKIEGLSPFTAYHYKLFASNAKGSAESPQQSLKTLPTKPGELPDHRGYAVVSPANKNGGFLEGITREGGLIQSSADGSGVTYVSTASTDHAEGNRSPEYDQLLSTRHGEGESTGWGTETLTTPMETAEGFNPGFAPEYRLFSSDLSQAIVKPYGESQVEHPQLSSEASERSVYARHNFACAVSKEGCYTALVNDANVTGQFKGEKSKYGGSNLRYLGSNESAAQSVLSSSFALTAEPVGNGTNLYESSGGALKLVSVLPSGSPANGQPQLGGPNSHLVRNAISADGSRVIWSDEGHQYVRDMRLGKTLQLDEPQGMPLEPGLSPTYQTASTDAGTIFFSDGAKLLPSSHATAAKPDLYVCEPELEAPTPKCKLSDLTTGAPGGEAGWLLGAVPGAAANGSDVFFAANGALAEGAKPGTCVPETLVRSNGEQTFGNTCNIFVAKRAGAGAWEKPELVAEVSVEDEWDWADSSGSFDLNHLTSRVSPDGQWYSFMSDRSLTGYNNHDALSGKADEEVFLYDVAAKHVLCASCDPTGARPHGVHDIEEAGEGIGLMVDRPLTLSGRWLAANVPGWTSIDLLRATYQSRYLLNGGRLFFNTAQALVPNDHNHTQDVYEFEPAGFKGPDGGEVC
ncbi:MAG: NHL repeat-containing protein, partial [Solirubrobacteraceae bacterium]